MTIYREDAVKAPYRVRVINVSRMFMSMLMTGCQKHGAKI